MNARYLAGLVAVFSVGIGTGASVRAAPGDLDPSFADTGFARFDVDGDSDEASSIFVQTDGKLLVGRINTLDTDDFSVLRFNTDGTLDSSFDGDGRTSLDIPNIKGWTGAVLQQADGNIVAAGGGTPDFALVRYLADGRLDTSFGIDGFAHSDMAVAAALQQSDGKLVVAEYDPCYGCWDYKSTPSAKPMAAPTTTGSSPQLARFDTAGVLDVGFGADGTVVLDSATSLEGLVEQPDGKLLVVGTAQPPSAPFAMTVYRLTQDGVLDPTFGDAGVVTINFERADGAAADASGEAVALEGDGKIVVAGTARFQCCNWEGSTGDLAIARLNADGGLDDTFGQGGRVLYDDGASETIDQSGLVIEPNGAIVVAGQRADGVSDQMGLPTYGLVARFTASGALDTSFGREGVTLIDVGSGGDISDASAHGIVRLPDGGIAAVFTVRASGGDPAIAVARLTATAGPGVIGFTRNAVSADEGTEATLVVHRLGGATGAVSVDYATGSGFLAPAASAGADFTPTAGTLSWADGDTTDRTITVPIAADTVTEDAETFGVALSNPAGGAGLATTQAEVTITDTTPFPANSGGGGSGLLETLLLGLLVASRRMRKLRNLRCTDSVRDSSAEGS